MGVLDESDIEKIEQSLKKRNVPKFFHTPRHGYDLSYWLALALVLSVVICGMIISLEGVMIDQYKQMDVENEKTFKELKTATLNNSDCESLFRIYQNYDSTMNVGVRQEIKDEISFRCR